MRIQKSGLGYVGHKEGNYVPCINGWKMYAAGNPNTYDDAYLLYDGEIYNHTELVSKYFSNTGFKTKSDTELLYNILFSERYDLLDKIEGIFAFVFYNKNQIIYARDPIWCKTIIQI